MTTAQESAARPSLPRKRLPLESTLALGALIAFAAVLQTLEAVTAALLLSLSIWIDFAILREQRPESKLSSELARCEWGKIFCVAAYVAFDKLQFGREGTYAWVGSIAALAGAVMVAAAMVITVIDMMRPPRRGRRRRPLASSCDELRDDKVLALSALLVAFLHITSFLTFALAFSDRFSGERALWATRYYEASSNQDDDANATGDAGTAPSDPCGHRARDEVRKFFFVQSAATLECTVNACAAVERDKSLRKTLCESDPEARRSAFATLMLEACTGPADSLERRAAAWNARQLYELRAHFRQMAAAYKPQAYLIEVRGHANDAPVRSDPTAAYASNYEISKQRADQVVLLLSKSFGEVTAGLSEPTVRWLAYGVSNEASFLDPEPKAWLDALPLQQKLSVEVRVQEVAEPAADRNLRTTSKALVTNSVPRDLHLIDYLYFTIYTITTTGYGDIVPTSNYAKFLASLANLVELLFVVVLVNVVANTKPSLGDGGDESSGGDDHAIRSA